MVKVFGFIFCVLVFAQSAVAQPQSSRTGALAPAAAKRHAGKQSGYPRLKTQAEETAQASLNGDFEKLVDYTYPAVIEMGGGKDKTVAFLKNEFQQLKSEGFEIVSVVIGDASRIEKLENQLFALIPMKITLKVPQGKAASESTLVGISNDNGENWKFISGVSQDKFKKIFPKAAQIIQIPEEKMPVVTGN